MNTQYRKFKGDLSLKEIKSKNLLYSRDLAFEKLQGQLEEKTYLYSKLQTESKYVINKQKEVLDKIKEILGNYKHYSTPDEKQNAENEEIVDKAYELLEEIDSK